MSENQDKIKFERTDKGTWSKIVENKTQGTHDNSIVIVTDDNLIYTQGTHIGASLGSSQNNTIFFKDTVNIGTPNGLKYLYVGPQNLTVEQQKIVRRNIGAAYDVGHISQKVYQVYENIPETTEENKFYITTGDTIELWENTVKLNIMECDGAYQPIFKYVGMNEVSVVVSNKTDHNISMVIGEIQELDNVYIINNKSTSYISITVAKDSSVEINILNIDNEARIIILQ